MAAETKERILDVAERLFADFGFPVTSLRDITHEADVNLAAVNYHFGSKEALLEAVLERRFRPITDRRLALLDELEKAAGSTSPELEDILRAFLGPPFYKQGGVGRLRQESPQAGGPYPLRDQSGTQEPRSRTSSKACWRDSRQPCNAPSRDLDSDEADRRFRFVMGSMVFTMMWEERMVRTVASRPRNPERLLESLVRFSVAGMAAPSPALAPVRVGSQGGVCVRRWLGVVAAIVMAGGCASAAPVEPPALEGVELPVTWTANDGPAGQIAVDWWTDFNDPGLSAAVETVLTHNFDLQTAAARLEQAAADARAAAAGLKPTIQASLQRFAPQAKLRRLPDPG